MKAMRVALIGAKGRMGQAIAAAASSTQAIIVSGLDQGDDLEKGIDASDVLIDFSHPTVTDEICRIALNARKPMVIGTTGHSNAERAVLERASQSLPIILSPNFSIGINTLFSVTRKTAEMLG